jgi:2-polyprenyl-6-methoxyphenol hydroxylase-like FAD-dependent oxidoreductase
MEERDAVIVGARCAGSTLATALAKRGWDVLMVDRDTFPSETISTHMLYPNTLARLDELGVLATLRAAHELPLLRFRFIGLGHEFAGGYTPIRGFDRCAAPRRVALDKAGVDTALASGADGRFGERVVDLIGSGTDEDPVAGIVLESERIGARWVFGADGRGSTVAGRLGLEKERPLRGEMSFLFGYWKGIPDDGHATMDIRRDRALSSWAVEDGVHMLFVAEGGEFTRGSKEERRERYREALRRFPETVDPDALEQAEMVSDVVVVPESMLRGFFRQPAGPGWALLGDAGHFKHPATAQGIADAVEQAVYIAASLADGDGGLDGYEQWREERAREHYEWSFVWGRFPRPETEALFRGWRSEPEAGQDLRDSFSRLVAPSQAVSPERLERWFAS